MKNWKTTLAIGSMLLFTLCEINAQSSVWKIDGKGTTLYLGGTIHVLRPSDYPLPAEYDEVYNLVNTIVLEADVKKLEDPQVSQSLMAKTMYTDGGGLSKTLKKETYEALKTELQKIQIPIEGLEQFKPPMVIMTLTMLKLQRLGITSEGVDKHYYKKSESDNKKIEFFETVEEQIKMITTMGKGNEDNMVMQTIKDLDKMEEELLGMLSDWKLGESKTMDLQTTRMIKEYPSIYKSLLVDRNNAWLPKIDLYMDTKNTEFILVGTMHLHGPDGLLKQMKDKGYTVTQVIAKGK